MEEVATPRGRDLASHDLLRRVVAKGRTISFAWPGSEEERYLEVMQANANVGGENLTEILLRTDARTIEALEEFLHGTQWKLGIIDRLGVLEAELHVKEFMIRHARLLAISEEDVFVLTRLARGVDHERDPRDRNP